MKIPTKIVIVSTPTRQIVPMTPQTFLRVARFWAGVLGDFAFRSPLVMFLALCCSFSRKPRLFLSWFGFSTTGHLPFFGIFRGGKFFPESPSLHNTPV